MGRRRKVETPLLFTWMTRRVVPLIMRTVTAVSPRAGSPPSQSRNPFYTAASSLGPAIEFAVLGIFLAAASPVAVADSITLAGVNDSGVIVGDDYNGTTYQAFMYNPSTGATTLIGPAGSTNSQAYGINDSGQISGVYTNS